MFQDHQRLFNQRRLISSELFLTLQEALQTSELSKLKMSSSDVQLFIFISCFLVADRIISGVASSVEGNWMKLEIPSEEVFVLNMAPNSVDDQFIGCEEDAEKLVINTHLPQELELNAEFKKLWDEYSNLNYYNRSIRVYTAESSVYKDLNNNITNSRENYKSQFHFKALHFFLTRTIQERKPQKCKTVYRRTRVSFPLNVKNHEMRFGRFASASVHDNLISFGSKSCFKISTCYGADIAKCSKYKCEGEVLIPPYEKFKITDIQNRNNEMNCEVLYILESSGAFSNMNCEILKNRSGSRHAAVLNLTGMLTVMFINTLIRN